MTIVHFMTHPEVIIEPAMPVTDWPLSPLGLQRMHLALRQPWLAGVRAIFSSAERKARDAAALMADYLGLSTCIIETLGENDRSATGYLPKAEFDAVADTFFAYPQESVRGWERAVDAQRRIIGAVDRAIARSVGGDVAIVSHGGVGALLLCHLKGLPISRGEDQPGAGGGHVYAFDAASRRLLSGWRRIEDAEWVDDR
jgi:broad specificity phosphatase PhoE